MAYGQTLRCVTWNVHRAKGVDGRTDPSRVERVIATEIAERRPQILALQEADEDVRPHVGIFDVAAISDATGLRSVHCERELCWGEESDGFLGTILFLSPDFETVHADVVDLPGHCHRGAITVEARLGEREIRVMSTHLSLSQPLRVMQMRILGQYLRRRPDMQTILLGDLNEWRPWGGLMFQHRLVGRRFTGPARRTFPTRRPILPLDRIMTDREAAVSGVQTIRTEATRHASDHLPLLGEVTVL